MKGRTNRSGRGSTRVRRATSGVVSTTVGGVASAAKSLLRLTPAGDAARMWLPTAISSLGLAFAFLMVGGPPRYVHWLLAAIVFYGLFLVLTWSAMYLSTSSDVRRWALAQEIPNSMWQRLVEEISGRRVFSGGAGMNLIVSFSLGGLFLALSLLPQSGDLEAQPLRALLCVLGVLLSWTLLHTSFAMYYSHLYYRILGNPGGLEFPREKEPAALDFAYFAFTVGTAFSTSDVAVTSSRVRLAVLAHSVLAFFYNATILALVVNFIIVSSV